MAIVLQGGDPNVFDLRAARGSEGGRQLVTRQQFATHDLLIQYPIVDQSSGRSFNPRFQLLALESHECHAVVKRNQGRGGNDPAQHGVVSAVHRVLNGAQLIIIESFRPSWKRARIHGRSNLHAVRDGTRVLRTIALERISASSRRSVLPRIAYRLLAG